MRCFEVWKWLHIAGGMAALVTFWLPWLTVKGSRLHRTVGWAYVGAMGLIALTAPILCVYRLSDGILSNDSASIFLMYLSLLSVSSTSLGVRALRAKRRTHHHRWDLSLAAALD